MSNKRDRDWIAQRFLYATCIFDSAAEIKANPQHQLVKAAYEAADEILARVNDNIATETK